MGSAEVLDLESLIKPISEESPSGPALRSDATLSLLYSNVREAGQRARDAERKAIEYSYFSDEEKEYESPPEPPNWKEVVASCQEILSEKSKDLWIAAWMLEALARTDGFVGLRDGFRLVRELVENFWDTVHPQSDDDEDDEEETLYSVSQLDALNGTFPAVIREIPITPETSQYDPLTSSDYIDAVKLDQSSDPEYRASKIEQGAPTLEMFQNAISKSPDAKVREIRENIQEAIDEFNLLDHALREKCGVNRAPASSDIGEALGTCLDRISYLTKHLTDETDEAAGGGEAVEGLDGDGEVAVAAAGAGIGGARKGGSVTGDVRSREEAFHLLLKVSDFFKRTEPHTPVSYAVEQAVRWGRMSLPDLMNDLIGDASVRREMFRRTGIPDPDEESN